MFQLVLYRLLQTLVIILIYNDKVKYEKGLEIYPKREILGPDSPIPPQITKQKKMLSKWSTHQNKFPKTKLKFIIHEN